MGDVLTLVEKAQETIDAKEAARLEKKILKDTFTLEDFLDQVRQVKKMGPLQDLVGMIPGVSKIKGLDLDEKAIVRVEAVINSMTPEERRRPEIIDGSRTQAHCPRQRHQDTGRQQAPQGLRAGQEDAEERQERQIRRSASSLS